MPDCADGGVGMDISKFVSSSSHGSSGQEPRFLEGLPPDDFEKIVSGGEVQRLDAREILISEGGGDSSLYFLMDGEMDVLVPQENGWLRVAVLGAGSVIGEMAFLDNLPRSARVVARAPSTALRMTRESFQEFAVREPVLSLVFLWELSRIVSLRLRRVERFDAAEAAREQERKSLAEELHDETMADLAATVLELALMKRQFSAAAPELGAGLDELRIRLRLIDRRLREIVMGIFPPALPLRGLEPALNSLLNDISLKPIVNPHPLEVELTTTGFDSELLPEDVAIAVFRVIQQGVNNVIKHAQAKSLRIDLTWSDSELTFSVVDDGVGFDVENPSTGHFGLASLTDRIERLLGTIEIESQQSVGTKLTGRVPVLSEAPRPTETRVLSLIINNRQPQQEVEANA